MRNFYQRLIHMYDIYQYWAGGMVKRSYVKIMKFLTISVLNVVTTRKSQRNISIKSTMK